MSEYTQDNTERITQENEGLQEALAMMQEILNSKPENREAIINERAAHAKKNIEYFDDKLIGEDDDDEREQLEALVRHWQLHSYIYSCLQAVCIEGGEA